MTPNFELALSENNSPESIQNYNVLSNSFIELERKGKTLLVKSPEHGSYTKFSNEDQEELYIYPKQEEWFLSKKENLKNKRFSFLNVVNILPIREDDGNLRLLITDNNFENILRLPLLKEKVTQLNYYYYGKVEFRMCGQRGNYYEDEEEYNNMREFLENLTGLNIEDCFVQMKLDEDSSENGEISNASLQLALTLK